MIERITLAITGASGVQYSLRLLECLIAAEKQLYFLASQAAHVVFSMEMNLQLPSTADALQVFLTERYQAAPGQITVFNQQQWAAPIASGSNAADAMVICPCSSGCLSALATGASNNLLERAADVMIKERRPLILVHRETPLSVIHLENALKLAQLGVTILPANPGFYHKPQRLEDVVDFIVARLLDHLKIPHELIQRWG